MTVQEIKDLIASKMAGQGSAVDAGSALPEILNGIVDAIGQGGGGGSTPVETTWSALKELRDGGQLTVGGKYRITDYVATTTQEESRSANHPFDIIVTATAANKLAEKAFAALHNGDTYFANCDLLKWELWYSLDNDSTKYLWADPENGKGVIYRMIDEFGNDAPFDFKGIQFKRYTISSIADFAQQFSGICVAPQAYFNPELNLQISDDSFAWFYLFSCFQASGKQALPTSEYEYFDTTVKIQDAKVSTPYVNGSVANNQFFSKADAELGNNVVISQWESGEDVDENDNPFQFDDFGSVIDLKLLGGGANNTFMETSHAHFYGEVYENIWINGSGSYGRGSIGGNMFIGPLFQVGSESITVNYIFAGVGNVVSSEMQQVCAKGRFDQNVIQTLFSVIFECGFTRGEIGNEVAYATITATDPSKNIEHAYILSGTRGTAASPINITFPHQEARFAQFAAKDSSGNVKVWVPADLVS